MNRYNQYDRAYRPEHSEDEYRMSRHDRELYQDAREWEMGDPERQYRHGQHPADERNDYGYGVSQDARRHRHAPRGQGMRQAYQPDYGYQPYSSQEHDYHERNAYRSMSGDSYLSGGYSDAQPYARPGFGYGQVGMGNAYPGYQHEGFYERHEPRFQDPRLLSRARQDHPRHDYPAFGQHPGHMASGLEHHAPHAGLHHGYDMQPHNHSGLGPRGYIRTDERLREDLCERLTHDHMVDAREIDVQVKDGVATLSGSVSDRGMKHRTEDLVHAVPGIKDVQNNLRVVPVQHPAAQATGAYNASLGQGQASSTYSGASLSNQAAGMPTASKSADEVANAAAQPTRPS